MITPVRRHRSVDKRSGCRCSLGAFPTHRRQSLPFAHPVRPVANSTASQVAACGAFRLPAGHTDELAATKQALRSLARRIKSLTAEAADLARCPCTDAALARRHRTHPHDKTGQTMNRLRHTLRSRLRPRRRAMPEMPGLWPSSVSFYEQARTRIRLDADGWEVQSRHPGHPFVAWELAVRHEAAFLEAAFHYTQICDLPTEEEYSARTTRIAALLAHAEHLSELERSIRPMLPTDSTSIRSLAFSPHPPTPPTTAISPAAAGGQAPHPDPSTAR